MADFKRHDIQSAPEGAKPFLENSQKNFGMIPGLHAVMAESPQVLEAYQKLHQLVLDSSFTNDAASTVRVRMRVRSRRATDR